MDSDGGSGSPAAERHPHSFTDLHAHYIAELHGVQLRVECTPAGWDACMVGPRLWISSAPNAEEAKRLAEEAARAVLPAGAVIEWKRVA
jgi:hypothetical protein